jgi:cell division protein FtsB
MKLSSLLSITLLGVITYLLLELVFGSYGIMAYAVLEKYAREAETELADLEARHDELQRQARNLAGDRETVRLEARDIGFVLSNEVIVRIEGHEPRPRHRYMPGAAPASPPRPKDNRPLFRAIALVVTLVGILVETLRNTTHTESARPKGRERWGVEVEGESVSG